MASDKSETGRWTIYVCEECGSVSGFPETCHSPLHMMLDRKPTEVVAVDALLSDEAIEVAYRKLYGDVGRGMDEDLLDHIVATAKALTGEES